MNNKLIPDEFYIQLYHALEIIFIKLCSVELRIEIATRTLYGKYLRKKIERMKKRNAKLMLKKQKLNEKLEKKKAKSKLTEDTGINDKV